MTSYVQKKSRVFRAAGEPEALIPKRSEARLKRYPSATDARAWTLENEDRRQHILEILLQKTAGLNLGRFIPLEVLINTLLANKDADIERLKKQLDELQKLLDAYRKRCPDLARESELDKLSERFGVASGTLSSKNSKTGASSTDTDIGESTTTSPEKSRSSDYAPTVPEDSGDECAANKSDVAACESLTMEDLKGLSPDELRKLVIKKDAEIAALKKALAGQLTGDPNKEAGSIEDEIEELRRQGLLTPEKEIALLRKEIDVLKKCCAKLPAVLADNEALREQLGLGDTEGTLQDLKDKAKEADELLKKNNELEQQLASAKSRSQLEIASARQQMNCQCRELDAVTFERDSLRKKLAESEAKEQEIERLRYRVKETEVLRIERDRMKTRLDELSNIEMEYMDLLDKTKGFDSIRAERDMFKTKYEELLCIECEVEMLRAQLDASQGTVDEKNALQRQVCDLECCLADQEGEINRLVDHIESLAQGRDDQQSLAFDELEYMHTKVCDATANLLNNQPGGPEIEPAETDKYLLMKRNMSLETNLAGKQVQCQSTVAKLEMDINSERQRLEDLRKLLEREKHTNNELLTRLKMQTKAVSNMQVERELLRRKSSVHEGKLQRYIAAIEQEKVRVKELEVELDNEKVNVRRLKDMLNMEREASRSMKRKDSEQLENLRLELEQSLKSEMMLRMQLEQTYPPYSRQQCPNTRQAPSPIHPNSTSFYTELKGGEKSYQPRCQLRRDMRQTPNKEYED